MNHWTHSYLLWVILIVKYSREYTDCKLLWSLLTKFVACRSAQILFITIIMHQTKLSLFKSTYCTYIFECCQHLALCNYNYIHINMRQELLQFKSWCSLMLIEININVIRHMQERKFTANHNRFWQNLCHVNPVRSSLIFLLFHTK